MQKGKRYQFDCDDLKIGSEGKWVHDLQNILTSLGYYRGPYHEGRFCKSTERAVRRYQRFFRLKPDGIVGNITKKMIETPRCGVPDLPANVSGVASPYVLRGCKYNKNHLTFAFLNGTGDLADDLERNIVKQAFQAWQQIANLTFEEIDPNDGPDFKIAWRSHNHGDGSDFDGPGSVLAHAFFPPPCGGPHSGEMHFDESERWIEDPGSQGTVLYNVAVHEIGHLLGLRHSQDPSAIMYPYYAADRHALADDDVTGIRALYGEPVEHHNITLTALSSGVLQGGGAEERFEVSLPQTLAVSIDGPEDADFDIYVRKNEPPTENQWDYRAYTASSDEKVIFPAEPGVKYHIMIRSYQGGGNFQLKVEPGGVIV